MTSPRERMVASAALLIRERGAHPTAIADVLAHSGAPRGSAYHYFPGGRNQLLCEAVDYAGQYMAERMSRATSAVQMLDALIAGYRRQLVDSDYRAGCPVVAVTVEAGDPEQPGPQRAVIERAAAAFTRWADLIRARLEQDGVPAAQSEELAMLVLTAFEGAIVVARAGRDVTPLDMVHRRLRALLETATGDHRDDD
ncbi:MULTISPECIES: TetR/AcrR family transcriptional regulator [Mycolicibacterium]|uniref:TetR/AcrR family transcriptional regulator n=2 Tax=Mycolicibacterium TaxID=1866885 RepID=A0A9X3BPD0_9MYCO|nr:MULTISPECIES: TetR/AcrR family transcriptional regulator [Mycolicibacterium]MCV7171990.1 TetR/AcrR family transcriptional regulator [[Mycobacterium] manitobense]MDO3637559.1 TetR/AcrR family transcriptional regulator [Mycolicibacterium arseniciresistens]